MTQQNRIVYADMHTHSTVSDGSLTPVEIVRLASQKKIKVLALTDHDSISGIGEAEAEANRLGVHLVAGVEISAKYQGGIYHVLGYGLDTENDTLTAGLKEYRRARDKRNEVIVEKLNAAGIDIDLEEIILRNEGVKSIGRPHIAKILVERNIAPDFKQAFSEYLGRSGRAFVKKEIFSPEESIALIHAAGGLAVIAHPMSLNLKGYALKEYLGQQKELGLDGIEVYSSAHTFQQGNSLNQIADELELLKTAGSDFHGNNKKEVQIGIAHNGNRIQLDWISEKLIGDKQTLERQSL
ncbi:MAG: PHP domain-containing protein [Deltaproteobacteria bacterium]|nr:PHP domain-containing protein [Deltaproteobacteria bacterium]